MTTPRPASAPEDGTVAAPEAPTGEPTRVHGPLRSAVIAAVVLAATAVIVLEFLVLTSFVGQRLWNDPRLFHELRFTLPLAIWLGLLAVCAVLLLRIVTSWLRIGDEGLALNGLFRRARRLRWDGIGRIVAVGDIARRPASSGTPAHAGPYEGLYVLDADDRRLVTVSGRLFGATAQQRVLEQARQAGARVEVIDRMTPKDLRERVRRGLTLVDLHPGLVVLAALAFYVGHTVLSLAVWGL